jgi:type III restriction enzyme
MSAPYAKARSTQIIKSSLRSWFKETFNITDEDLISLIVVHRNNIKSFKLLLERAKELYQQLPVKSEEVVPNDNWEVPKEISIFTDFAEVAQSKKSIIKEDDNKKLFVKLNKNGKLDLSGPEIKFIEGLENCDSELQWWYKNSHGESKYFGIAYSKPNGRIYGFYPDFILKTKKETLIVEIKDDKDFKAENAMKLRAGQYYIKEKNIHNEKLRFYIISPDDYENFFHLLQQQDLDKFKSIFEDRLLRYQKSNIIVIENKKDKTEKDITDMELLQELDKTIDEKNDLQLKNELLKISLKQAEENLKAIGKNVDEKKTDRDGKIKIPTPFNICVLGEVSDQALISKELNKYFAKLGIATKDWNIEYFNNTKLQNSDILRSLVKGQSNFNLIITGQIHHHNSKGNKKGNLVSELKNEKYIPHRIGSDPKDLLTPAKILEAIEDFLKGVPNSF